GPDQADVRDPAAVVEPAGEDAPEPDRPAGGGPRHRPRQDRRAVGGGRADAAVPAGPPRVLRGTGEDPRGLRVRVLRADDGGTDGLLRRTVPGRRRLPGDVGEGQPVEAGDGVVPEVRRLLPRLDRWSCGTAG